MASSFSTDQIKEFWAFDEGYKKVLNIVQVAINASNDFQAKKKIFDIFAKDFTVPPELWEWRYEVEEAYKNDIFEKCYPDILHRGFSHFYSTDFYKCLARTAETKKFAPFTNFNKFLPFQYSYFWPHFSTFNNDFLDGNSNQKKALATKYIEYALTFPHKTLEEIYKLYDEYSDWPLSDELRKKYEKALANKKTIEDLQNYEVKEYIEKLFELMGDKFAIQTIECRLARSYDFVDFWKTYIKIMRDKNFKIMLQIMERYIKLFIDDFDMKYKYSVELEHAKLIFGFDNLPNLQSYLFDAGFTNIQEIQIPPKPDTFRPQNFSFPGPIIAHFYSQASMKLRKKLYETYKYFFIRQKIPFCHQLKISINVINSVIHKQSFHLKLCEAENPALTNLHITNHLVFNHENTLMLSNIIQKLNKCEARFMEITDQDLTWKKYNFLISSGKVEKIKMINVWIVWKPNGSNLVPLEKIVEKLPNASVIHFTFCPINSKKTMRRIGDLKRNVKIIECKFGSFNERLTVESYCYFLKKQAAPKSFFVINFQDGVPMDFRYEISNGIKSYLERRWQPYDQPSDQKPYCLVNYFNDP